MRFWRERVRFVYSGVVGGLIFYTLSFTPSLLARTDVIQAAASGIAFATGYGVGVAIAKLYKAWRQPKTPKVSELWRRRIVIALLFIAGVFMVLGSQWQADIRELTEAQPVTDFFGLNVIVIAFLLSWGLITFSRFCLKLSRRFAKWLNKRFNPKFSAYAGGILAAILVVGVINGVIISGAFNMLNYVFGLVNNGTPEGVYQPQDPIFAGSPDSAIDWNTLGEKGREFVATGPTAEQVEQFQSGAVTPSRLYVGMQSAETLDERVTLIIEELNRTDAQERSAVIIAIPTGSGGINSKSVSTVEYVYGGDTTAVGIQYSYLPSWISFLADQEKTKETGKVLFNAIYDWWEDIEGEKPKLLMYGESLGTLGADGAFSSAADVRNRTDGVLLVGPPGANRLWQDIVGDRDEGSPQVLPIYQNGEQVRFGASPEDLLVPDSAWNEPRLAILQHASDPVVWWTPDLLTGRPDWLEEPRGRDVLPNMRWYPLLTFWQVALDLPFAFSATDGHGHRYGVHLTDSWLQILGIELSDSKHQQLNDIIEQVKG